MSPLYFFLKKLATFFCSSLSLFIDFTRVSPPEAVTPDLFYLSDLVSPLFFVNLPTIFSFGCYPLDGVTQSGSQLSLFSGSKVEYNERVKLAYESECRCSDEC